MAAARWWARGGGAPWVGTLRRPRRCPPAATLARRKRRDTNATEWRRQGGVQVGNSHLLAGSLSSSSIRKGSRLRSAGVPTWVCVVCVSVSVCVCVCVVWGRGVEEGTGGPAAAAPAPARTRPSVRPPPQGGASPALPRGPAPRGRPRAGATRPARYPRAPRPRPGGAAAGRRRNAPSCRSARPRPPSSCCPAPPWPPAARARPGRGGLAGSR